MKAWAYAEVLRLSKSGKTAHGTGLIFLGLIFLGLIEAAVRQKQGVSDVVWSHTGGFSSHALVHIILRYSVETAATQLRRLNNKA